MNRIIILCMLLLLLAPAHSFADGDAPVVVDPGHGGYDTGIRDPSHREKDVTLEIAREMEAIFRGIDRELHLTRNVDNFVTVSERRGAANRLIPLAFISIHLSGTEDFSIYVNRYERRDADLPLRQYYMIESNQRRFLYESKILSSMVSDIIKNSYQRKVRRSDLPIPLLAETGAPAVMVEVPYGVLEEGDYDRELMRLASALTIAVMAYERGKEEKEVLGR